MSLFDYYQAAVKYDLLTLRQAQWLCRSIWWGFFIVSRQLTLLIVNASAHERQALTKTLSVLDVFTIIAKSDSQDALSLLKTQAVDLVITGLDVGKIDGWRFSRMIRSGLLTTPKNTPIVLIPPTYCERIAETTARSYSIDAVLPFERQDMLPQILANVLSTHLDKSSRLNLLLLEPNQQRAQKILWALIAQFRLHTCEFSG